MNGVLLSTIEGAAEMIAIEDLETRYLAFNSAYQREFKKIFGVELKVGDRMTDALAHLPGEQKAALALFERTIRGEEFTVTHEFGDEHLERRFYELRCFPVYNGEGRPAGGTHIVRDITDQHRAEEALRASEGNYRRIIESSRDCVKVLDLDGTLLSINPWGQRLMELENLGGYLGTNWLEGWKGEDRLLAEEALAKARSGGVAQFSASGLTAQNKTVWWEETVSPILDSEGQPERLLVIARDMTDRKTAEELLLSEREFLRRVIDATPSMIFVKDWEGCFVLVNEALAHAYGTTTQGVIGKTDADFNADREEVEHFMRDDREVMSTRRKKLISEEKVTFANGEVHWFSTIKVPLVYPDGSCDKVLGVASDITARKMAETALQRFRSALDSAADNIFLIDPEAMRFLDVSHSACRDLAYTREELLSLGPLQIMPDLCEDTLRRKFEEIRNDPSGKGSAIETVHYRKDGTGFVVEVLLRPVEIQGRMLLVAVARDITERKRAEKALRTSEERLKLAQHAGRVGVFDWDMEADRAFISDELELIFGIEPGTMPANSSEWGRLVYPDDLPRVVGQFDEYLRNKAQMVTFEYRIRRSDGEIRWLEMKGQIGYTEADVPGRMVGTIADITERKLGMEALRESEEKFRALAENARASFGIVQGQRFVYANPYFSQISGYSVEEILNMDFPQLVHPDYREQMIEWARLRQMGMPVPNHYEFAMVTKSGEMRWVEFSVGTIQYRGRPAIIGTGFDITERKLAESALKQRNERLSLLTETAALLLRTENPETMVAELFEKVAPNLDLQAFMNFSVNEAGDALRLDSCAGVPAEVARQLRRLEFGQGVCGTVAQCGKPINASHIRLSGDEKVQLLKQLGIRAYFCNPLMAGGRLLGTLAFGTSTRDSFNQDDLDFMRAISHYVAMANERLRLMGELKRHNVQLSEIDQRKDEFLAMLAHELRNPLAPIRNAIQIMGLLGIKEQNLERQRVIVERQVTHMARLLDDLLDISRVKRGKVTLNTQPVVLAEVINHAVEVATPLIQARRHELHLELPPPALRVDADFDRLAQALGNLLTNAAKYTSEGGQIWIVAAREGNRAMVRVRDTGIGIAPEMLPRVFDLFTQADQGLAHAQGGLGIGLTLVRSLIQMQGGHVEAHSEGIGKGSEFVITMPVSESEENSQAA